MTNDPNPIQPNSKKWPRYLLVVSLGLNLLIVGLVAGAVMRGGPPDHVRQAGGERNFGVVGLRPYTRSLSPDDRSALRDAIVQNKDNISAGRETIRAHVQDLAAALRADPFDSAELDAVLTRQRDLVQGNISLGHDLLTQQILTMTPQQRLDFAEGLENPRGPAKRRP